MKLGCVLAQAQIMVPKDSLSPSSEAQSSIIFKAHYSPRSHIIVFFLFLRNSSRRHTASNNPGDNDGFLRGEPKAN